MSELEKQIITDGGNLHYIYIGMTHMLSGYDHLLFILGVLFFIKGFGEIVKFITTFTIGHSLTLIYATFNSLQINYYLIDGIIALSVCYIAFANLNGFKIYLKTKPFNMLLMVFIFGLIHGFGLSTRLQELPLSKDELLLNIISFNIGIEFGQIIALTIMMIILKLFSENKYFNKFKYFSNIFLLLAGLVLFFFQLSEYNKSISNNYKNIIKIVIPANGEKEYKLWMEKEQTLFYKWETNKINLYFDFHGEPAADLTGYFKSYKEGTLFEDKGTLISPFIGTHGWYWKNSSPHDVTVNLYITGEYKISKSINSKF